MKEFLRALSLKLACSNLVAVTLMPFARGSRSSSSSSIASFLGVFVANPACCYRIVAGLPPRPMLDPRLVPHLAVSFPHVVSFS